MAKWIKQIKNLTILFTFRYLGAIFPQYVALKAYKIFTTPARHLPRPVDRELLRSAFVINENFREKNIVGYKFGTGDKVIILAHGWSSHALAMRGFIKKLLDEGGYTIIAFDAPAHGKSLGETLDVVTYIQFLEHIFIKYKPYGVIAHSMAGICSLFAILNTNLIGNGLAKVVVIATIVDASFFINNFIRHIKLNEKAIKKFLQHIDWISGGDSKRLDLSIAYPQGLSFPGLMVYDKNDSIAPYKEGLKLAKLWSKAEFVSTSHLGHLGVLKNPEVIQKVVDYINS